MKRDLFQLKQHDTSVKQELTAGLIGFFTIVYIIAVNSLILSEAGVPLEGAVLGTILTSFVGCLIMGIWANAPILVVPGMGINAMFTYTLVQSMELTWQQALGVTVISGLIFTLIAFSTLTDIIKNAIPDSLKEAIIIGIGLFLMLIGLENGHLVERGDQSIIALGNFSDPRVLATIITLVIAFVLFMRNVRGNFLWTILLGTGVGFVLGVLPEKANNSFSLEGYQEVFGAFTFIEWTSLPFLIAVFSITMVVLFENIGLTYGHVAATNRPEKFNKAFQANGISIMLSGMFGSSPTVSTAETTAAITAGGRTGLTTITTGFLFLGVTFFIPYIQMIPANAIAPILIIIGGLMVQNIRNLDLRDLSEAFPAIFVIVMIPFTYSIADGIAIGFILYVILKLSTGNAKRVSFTLYVIAFLFLLNFIIHFAI
ncbi:NCS2 family permease [Gracilibacillus kekensis]|uniref:Putative MFS transporter, AGZA family, xanthine/uracil permease n=1 Tax=Gracilibacillus kekensis TaxID=1027249 RepID=A0A1M7QGD2_9BACI|nr:NCS2 family permease [Gracilibacillus kekensis]SHN30153.1 putative MFS transporter, AGZA family, xanthine/uracil permease [Gracilibacillus kekensis]